MEGAKPVSSGRMLFHPITGHIVPGSSLLNLAGPSVVHYKGETISLRSWPDLYCPNLSMCVSLFSSVEPFSFIFWRTGSDFS